MVFNMEIQMIIVPVIGAVIGFLTNEIAIKMLFRPRKAIYLAGHKLPFTPGLIPKEQKRIAKSLGTVVSEQLLNSEILIDVLTSREIVDKISTKLQQLIEKGKENPNTIREVLLRYIQPQQLEQAVWNIEEKVTDAIYERLTNVEFGEAIAQVIMQGIRQKLESTHLGPFRKFMDDTIVEGFGTSLSQMIHKMLISESRELIEQVIETESEKILDTKICELVEKYEEEFVELLGHVLEFYQSYVRQNMKSLLETISLSSVVEERVSSFDAAELETLIFGLMKKELKAIVILGGILGFLMGCVNLFFL